jgi:predicted molibdopterin-dependent oxidoreductase YjgC
MAKGESRVYQGVERGQPFEIEVDGEKIVAFEGETIGAALLAAGRDYCRSTALSGTPRAPYCMMGVCFECLVTIDGTGNRQACMVRVEEGMRIETQRGPREIGR